ncbi:amidase [Amycolatopsis sp. TRM77291]
MNAIDLFWSDATDLAAAVAKGELTATEVATAYLRRIDELNPTLNAYVYVDRDEVLRNAALLDQMQEAGEPLGPLHGVPVAIKSLTDVKGMPKTAAMKIWEGAVAEKDSIVVERLRASGALILGLTNAPEFGYYGGTDNHLWGPTHNPWKYGHTPGGSSGGSAAAVAAGLTPLAEGTDGAGSVRIPASLCGVVGLKPSLGRIPQQITPSRSQSNLFHGPLTRSVADAAIMLDAMAGEHPGDVYSIPKDAEPYAAAVGKSISGWKIAYTPDLGTGAYVDPEVAQIVRDAVSAFEELGAKVTEATPEWPGPIDEIMWKSAWLPGYAGMNSLADWESLHDQVDQGFIEILAQGRELTAAEVGGFDALRGMAYDLLQAFMEQYDLIVSPVLTSATFPFDHIEPQWLRNKPLKDRILGWLLTYPFNILTNPAISVPAGFTADGRPVGLQIAGRFRADASVLTAAAAFETVRPWHDVRPQLG